MGLRAVLGSPFYPVVHDLAEIVCRLLRLPRLLLCLVGVCWIACVALRCAALHGAPLCCTVLRCAALCKAALRGTALHCTVMVWITLLSPRCCPRLLPFAPCHSQCCVLLPPSASQVGQGPVAGGQGAAVNTPWAQVQTTPQGGTIVQVRGCGG